MNDIRIKNASHINTKISVILYHVCETKVGRQGTQPLTLSLFSALDILPLRWASFWPTPLEFKELRIPSKLLLLHLPLLRSPASFKSLAMLPPSETLSTSWWPSWSFSTSNLNTPFTGLCTLRFGSFRWQNNQLLTWQITNVFLNRKNIYVNWMCRAAPYLEGVLYIAFLHFV